MMEETPHVGEDLGEGLRRGGRGRWRRAGGDGLGRREMEEETERNEIKPPVAAVI